MGILDIFRFTTEEKLIMIGITTFIIGLAVMKWMGGG